jgi:hypothetical protein
MNDYNSHINFFKYHFKKIALTLIKLPGLRYINYIFVEVCFSFRASDFIFLVDYAITRRTLGEIQKFLFSLIRNLSMMISKSGLDMYISYEITLLNISYNLSSVFLFPSIDLLLST